MTSQEINKYICRTEPRSYLTQFRPGDPRLGEDALALTEDLYLKLESKDWVLIGHPDDEGIQLNKGRIGSAKAPSTVRSFLYRLVSNGKSSFDFGDTDIDRKLNLSDRHQLAYQCSKKILDKAKLLVIGGGHDYAYPNAKAFLEKYPQALVINIDAHLDMRPMDPHPHSGTPFRRLKEEFTKFELIEVGIQNCFASKEQIEFAKKHNVQIILADDFDAGIEVLMQKISSAKELYLSIDIDGLTSSIAPGASAAWPMGLSYFQFDKIFNACLKNKGLKAVGIYEVSPPLDLADITSKLAAQILYKVLSVC